jgi:hypothetical protein
MYGSASDPGVASAYFRHDFSKLFAASPRTVGFEISSSR